MRAVRSALSDPLFHVIVGGILLRLVAGWLWGD